MGISSTTSNFSKFYEGRIGYLDRCAAINFGLTPGIRSFFTQASRATLANGVECHVWEGPSNTFYRPTSAEINRVSSSSNSDTGNVLIDGLDSGWNRIIQTIALTGQTPKALTTALRRINSAIVISPSTGLVGNVYFYNNAAPITNGIPDTATDVRAYIGFINNTTRNSLFTSAIDEYVRIRLVIIAPKADLTTTVEFTFYTQTDGSPIYKGSSFITKEIPISLVGVCGLVPPKTDTWITAKPNSVGQGASVALDFELMDKNILGVS